MYNQGGLCQSANPVAARNVLTLIIQEIFLCLRRVSLLVASWSALLCSLYLQGGKGAHGRETLGEYTNLVYSPSVRGVYLWTGVVMERYT